MVVRELEWNADDADGLVVRELEWNADDADYADFHCVTPSELCATQ